MSKSKNEDRSEKIKKKKKKVKKTWWVGKELENFLLEKSINFYFLPQLIDSQP